MQRLQRFHTVRTTMMLGVVVLLAVLTLAGCGGGGSGSSGNGSGTGKVPVTVGAKNDIDGQLLGEMYVLLLQHAGYTVTSKIPLGQTPVLDAAIKSGAIDIYPEFTGTALSLLNLPATQDAQAAYSTVKQAYQQKFSITWLDAAYNLNDSYAICTSQAVAQKYNLHSLSDLASVASQLTIASPQDGLAAAVNPVESGYNIKFGKVVQITEQLSFQAVTGGNAQLNVCYTTDPNIVTDNFVVLTDSKNVFPIYNPAPLVRDTTLSKDPGISSALNPLASKLTTDQQVKLITEVSIQHKTVHDVAQEFLKSQGLL